MPEIKSARDDKSTHSFSRKKNFQTKYKVRGTNQLAPSKGNSLKMTSSNMQLGSYNPLTTRNLSCAENCHQRNNFTQTSLKLTGLNLSQHCSQKCHCGDCLCGRHMCKLHVIKPDLRKVSTYKSNFKKAKSFIHNSSFARKQQTKSLPKVQMNSTYSFNFKQRISQPIQTPRPSDVLHFDGPTAKNSSYRNSFAGPRGSNPYIRPKQLLATGGNFQMKNRKTSYGKSFIQPIIKKVESGKLHDHLKSGAMNYFKESFYTDTYREPNPQDYSPRVKEIEKRQQGPNFSHQFQSTYLKEFIPNQSTVCPAKIKISSKYKDMLDQSKASFNQNSDFKGMSSSFHALAMAPPGIF